MGRFKLRMDTVNIWDGPLGSNTFHLDAYMCYWLTDHTLETKGTIWSAILTKAFLEWSMLQGRAIWGNGLHIHNVIHKWCPGNRELHLQTWSKLCVRAKSFLCKLNQNQRNPPPLPFSLPCVKLEGNWLLAMAITVIFDCLPKIARAILCFQEFSKCQNHLRKRLWHFNLILKNLNLLKIFVYKPVWKSSI